MDDFRCFTGTVGIALALAGILAWTVLGLFCRSRETRVAVACAPFGDKIVAVIVRSSWLVLTT